jgi:hypothetical protein
MPKSFVALAQLAIDAGQSDRGCYGVSVTGASPSSAKTVSELLLQPRSTNGGLMGVTAPDAVNVALAHRFLGKNSRTAFRCVAFLVALGALHHLSPSLLAQEVGGPMGPLRVSPINSRYFTDGTGKPVYLTGAHTWANLQEIGFTDLPPAFDYNAHLEFLKRHHHNFIRLWRWELTKWTEARDNHTRYSTPHPWERTGPGNALDGKPKFDLNRLNSAYFDRLRSRVFAAREQGIYVSIMLFEGWGLSFASWDGHPFNVLNNIQGINGDPVGNGKGTETHTLAVPGITRIQEAYVRRVMTRSMIWIMCSSKSQMRATSHTRRTGSIT